MSKTLIYLIAIFSLWLYFSFGNFDGKNTIKKADEAKSGSAGVRA